MAGQVYQMSESALVEENSSQRPYALVAGLGPHFLSNTPSSLKPPLAFQGETVRVFPWNNRGEDFQMDKARLDLFRGTLDVLILKALVWGPLHGYAITSLIRRQSDEALLVEEGTLYPALWRLENNRLLEAEWGLSENNRKAKFYRLTPDGRRHLRQ